MQKDNVSHISLAQNLYAQRVTANPTLTKNGYKLFLLWSRSLMILLWMNLAHPFPSLHLNTFLPPHESHDWPNLHHRTWGRTLAIVCNTTSTTLNHILPMPNPMLAMLLATANVLLFIIMQVAAAYERCLMFFIHSTTLGLCFSWRSVCYTVWGIVCTHQENWIIT